MKKEEEDKAENRKIELGFYAIWIAVLWIHSIIILFYDFRPDRLCGLVVRVLGYRSGGPGSIPGTTKKKVVGLERGTLIVVSTTEELLDRKAAAPV
jgi:hypothetical protein